ncbi:MAG: amidohydrolase family protein [Vicinamibacteria bacterium]
MLRTTVGAVAIAGLSAATAFAEKEDVYALVGARVVTVSGPTYESATVVLKDGVIESVGPAAIVPPGARVIDAKGLSLTPGLIDSFGGVGLPAARAGSPGATSGKSEAGKPNPLAPQALALDLLKPSAALKARDAGITTALVISADGVLPGRSALIDLAGTEPDAMVLRQPAALHLHMAPLPSRYPDSVMGIVALARQSLYDAQRYRDEWAAYERAPKGKKRPRYDAALVAWQDVLSGKLPLIVTAYLENDIRRALALAGEFHVRVIVAGAPQASRVVDLVKSRKLPLLVTVNFDPEKAVDGADADDEKERREIDEAETNPAALGKAGVPFALVSGHAKDFVGGIRKAVERGLPREAALRAVTLGAAEILGVADRTGSLEAGKIANVVAWSGEPLTEGATAKMVFVDGTLYEPEPNEKDKGKKGERDREPAKVAKPGRPAPPAAPMPEAASDKPIAIVGATVLTVGPRGTLDKGTVLVQGGRIVAVGRDVAVPAGARVIDGSGRFVMPGIIDAHSHTAIEGGVNECSNSVTAEVRIADVVDHHDIDVYRELAGGVTTVNALHGSCNTIGGQTQVLKLRWGKTPEEMIFKDAPRGIKFALGENVKRAHSASTRGARYPQTRMGVEVVLRTAFKEAQAYKREWEEYERKVKIAGPKDETPIAPRKNLQMEELKDILDGKVFVHSHCYRADEILMLMRVADEFGFKVRTFQHVLEGYKVASEIARHGAGASTFIDWWAFKMEALDGIPYNPAILAAKGVRVSLNSDSSELARRLYWDAAKAVKYGGVSEAEALKMITLNPAWQLGIDRRVGSIEVGKDADLALFSAHPFSPDARVETTLVDGVVTFDRARDLAARTATAREGGAQ